MFRLNVLYITFWDLSNGIYGFSYKWIWKSVFLKPWSKPYRNITKGPKKGPSPTNLLLDFFLVTKEMPIGKWSFRLIWGVNRICTVYGSRVMELGQKRQKRAQKGPKKGISPKNISYDFFLVIVDIIGSNLVKKPNCFIRLQGSDIFIQILGGLFVVCKHINQFILDLNPFCL